MVTTKCHFHLLDALKRDLSDADYQYIALYKKNEIIDNINSSLQHREYKEEILKHFHPNFINFLYKNHSEWVSEKIVECVTDDLYINDLLDAMENGTGEELDESIIAGIVNNNNLPVDTREKAFNLGCDYFSLNSFTENILDTVYNSCADLLFNTDKNSVPDKSYYKSTMKLLTNIMFYLNI